MFLLVLSIVLFSCSAQVSPTVPTVPIQLYDSLQKEKLKVDSENVNLRLTIDSITVSYAVLKNKYKVLGNKYFIAAEGVNQARVYLEIIRKKPKLKIFINDWLNHRALNVKK